MKLVYAIVRNDNEDDVVSQLTRHHYSITRLSTTGGFLKKGNTTLMIGTPDEQVETVKRVLHETCAQRTQVEVLVPHGTGGVPTWNVGPAPLKVTVGGATVFVLDVAEFQKL